MHVLLQQLLLKSNMEDCIFCKIVRGDIPCRKIYEDDNCIAFLDIGPQTKGHTLVVPKEHFEGILDVSDETLKDIILVVKKIAKHIDNVLEPKGVRIVQNNGNRSGPAVFHLHFHVRPVYEDTEEDTWEPIEISDEEMDKLEKSLKMI